MPNETQPLVYVVVLNWNSAEETLKCVASLQRSDYGNFRIIVIDNGSRDGSVEILSRAKGIELVCNAENLGFSGGCNVGIKAGLVGGAQYIWLVNSDTSVAPDCLTKLVHFAESRPNMGLASPLIRYASHPDRIQFCGSMLDRESHDMDPVDLAQARRIQSEQPELMLLWGTALLVHRRLVELIGYLDEGLFAYFEDMDYSMRSIAAGFRNVMVFDAEILHDNPIDQGIRKPHYYYYMTRNKIVMRKRYIRSFTERWRTLWWDFNRLRGELLTRNKPQEVVEATLDGLWDGLIGTRGSFDNRRRMPLLARRFLMPGRRYHNIIS
ncbi:MAG: glycosyltransferase family 2 protein [Burkholderiales bacterium]|nr:glycosyltransferase family 2 protein [Burkholderiales bacterium]MDE1925770.1 glycosyltransferase family 2 protein [Burkholderiales bacterium]